MAMSSRWSIGEWVGVVGIAVAVAGSAAAATNPEIRVCLGLDPPKRFAGEVDPSFGATFNDVVRANGGSVVALDLRIGADRFVGDPVGRWFVVYDECWAFDTMCDAVHYTVSPAAQGPAEFDLDAQNVRIAGSYAVGAYTAGAFENNAWVTRVVLTPVTPLASAPVCPWRDPARAGA
jgi:hypothetical protein